ncbi:MAG: DUF3352 domain-containing protein [Synechococcales cyanobacterium RU_4_20]|nr:DUF3352 domain-containing protein [Synechococcales cyanobacterium RU_4_20]NJR68501.1 DUF3352 domain-containing protein [Synechococcales cyanobacterium CRU_2_2]
MSLIRKTALALGATTVVAGGALAYVHFKGVPFAGGEAAGYASAQVIPDDATLALYVSAEPEAWAKLGQFGTAAMQKQLESGLQTLEKDAIAESGISFETDVLPVISGVTLAMLPATDVQSADAPEYLVVVGIKNPTKALSLLAKINGGDDMTVEIFEHKGVKISQMTPKEKGSNPMFSALLGQKLVISPLRRPVEMAIETTKGDPSLAELPGAAAAFKGDLGLENPVARVYAPSYGKLVSSLMAASPSAPPLSAETQTQLEQIKSLQAGLGIGENGLHFKTVVNLDPKLRPADYKPSANQLQTRFPANTIAYFNGQGIGQSWAQMTEQAAALPESAELFKLLRDGAKQVDLDLDKDIFAWMTGEFGFGVMPVAADQSLVGQVGFGTALVMDSGDRPTTEATLKKLDQLAQQNYLKPKSRKVGQTEVIEWLAPGNPPEPMIGHGWIDSNSLFIAAGKPVVEAMTQAPQQPLSTNPIFQAVMAELSQKGMGYGFINFEAALATPQLNAALALSPDPQTADAVRTVQAIGVASNWDKADTSELEVYIALKKTAELEAKAR